MDTFQENDLPAFTISCPKRFRHSSRVQTVQQGRRHETTTMGMSVRLVRELLLRRNASPVSGPTVRISGQVGENSSPVALSIKVKSVRENSEGLMRRSCSLTRRRISRAKVKYSAKLLLRHFAIRVNELDQPGQRSHDGLAITVARVVGRTKNIVRRHRCNSPGRSSLWKISAM